MSFIRDHYIFLGKDSHDSNVTIMDMKIFCRGNMQNRYIAFICTGVDCDMVKDDKSDWDDKWNLLRCRS